MSDRVVFLGTGTSFGVPMLGCGCAVCRSTDPRNRRLRCSALLEHAGRRLLVDPSPDFRAQALREGIDALDAVVVTHAHADHILGLDDLRPLSLSRDEALPVHCDRVTGDTLREMFPYVFSTERKRPGLPWLALRELRPGVRQEILPGVELLPLRTEHGAMGSLALRFGDFAWITDLKGIAPTELAALAGLRWLALDMLRVEPPHPTHLSLEESLALRAALGDPETWFIHMGHEVDHETVERGLPPGCRLAVDGLRLPLPEGVFSFASPSS
ncbi:MAG: MBL fold metallo-hydrolase [Planctomycetota bacterium]